MHPSLRKLALSTTMAATFTLALVPAVLAGGVGAKLEGPARDGVTYTLQTFACSGDEMTGVSGAVEGVVHGERRTLPLALVASGTKGTYVFHRTWPRDGRWLVRLAFAGAHSSAMVAEIGRDGRVRRDQFLWESDGRRECEARLAAAVK